MLNCLVGLVLPILEMPPSGSFLTNFPPQERHLFAAVALSPWHVEHRFDGRPVCGRRRNLKVKLTKFIINTNTSYTCLISNMHMSRICICKLYLNWQTCQAFYEFEPPTNAACLLVKNNSLPSECLHSVDQSLLSILEVFQNNHIGPVLPPFYSVQC